MHRAAANLCSRGGVAVPLHVLGLSLLIVLVAACGSDETSLETDATPTSTNEGPPAALDCTTQGYPCNWGDDDREVLQSTLDLLRDVGARLDNGESPEAVALDLAARPDVAATNWAAEGVLFRLKGGLPVSALSPAARPLETALPDRYVASPTVEAAGQLSDIPLSASPIIGADTTYEPPREPDTRPRQGLVLMPFHNLDAVFHGDLTGIPSSPADATSAVLNDSRHFEVTNRLDHFGTPADWASFRSYDVVVIGTHGAHYSCDGQFEMCGTFLAGPQAGPYLDQLLTPNEDGAYPIDIRGDYGTGWTFTQPSVSYGEIHIAFHTDWFTAVYGSTGVGEAVVIINACRMGGEKRAVSRILAGAEGTVFSWDDAIPGYSADSNTAALLDMMLEGADAVAAYTELVNDGNNVASSADTSADLIMTPESGNNRRVRDVVEFRVDGKTAEPTEAVQARGTLNDGNEDRITNAEIRIDAVILEEEENTKVTITVDGEPLRVIQDGEEVKEITLSGRTQREFETAGPWRHHVIDLDNAILPFDLKDEDLTQLGQTHTWRIEVVGNRGEPTIHEVRGVIFRLGSIEILHPETEEAFTSGQRIFIDGEANDDEAEEYPLVVQLEHLGEDDLDKFAISIEVDDQTVELAVSDFEDVGNERLRYTDSIVLHDFPQAENPIRLSAHLDFDETKVDDHIVDPAILVVRAVGHGTLTIGGVAFEFDVPRCHVGLVSETDDAGNREFNLQGEGEYNGDPFLIDVSNRTRTFSDMAGADEVDSIVIQMGDDDVIESTPFYTVDPTSPEVVRVPPRFLSFDEEYRTVTGTAWFWGEFVNDDPATQLFVVVQGVLRATCP